MKLQKSKKQQRQDIAKAMEEFLGRGGKVSVIPKGISGNNENINLFKSHSEIEPKSTRTPLTEVVKALEERKKPGKTHRQKKVTEQSKKLIVDDFGDPIRWVWKD